MWFPSTYASPAWAARPASFRPCATSAQTAGPHKDDHIGANLAPISDKSPRPESVRADAYE